MSRLHARLRPASGGVVLEDLQSANGTFVNDKRIFGAKRLVGGETIRIGTTEIQLVVGQVTRRQQESTAKELPRYRVKKPDPMRYDEQNTLLDGDDVPVPAAEDAKPPASMHVAFLEVVREDLTAGLPIPMGTADRAGVQALELGIETQSADWVNFAVELYTRLALVMPAKVRNLLELAYETVPSADAEALVRYARLLETIDESVPRSTLALIERVADNARNTSRIPPSS